MTKTTKQLFNNWRDEKESADLYRTVAAQETDEKRKNIFFKIG